MARMSFILVMAAAIGLVGCSRENSTQAVKAAIQNHLHANPHLMLNSFTTDFETVRVTGDRANALVKYQSRNLPGLAVHVRYSLKLSHGQWMVLKASTDSGELSNPSNPHAGSTLDQVSPQQRGLPPPIASH